MSNNENIIEGEVVNKEKDLVDNNSDSAEWFISAIKGNLDFLKSNYNNFVGSRGEGGRTAMMYAADSGNLDCVKFLASFDAEIGQQDYDGNTAMMYAAKNGFLDCISVLVEEENNIINKDGKRAINFAIENNHDECAGFLELYEYLDDSDNSSTDNNDDSNDERNLIKENKRLKRREQILKKAGKDMDKSIGVEREI